jgi:hypothetical protein
MRTCVSRIDLRPSVNQGCLAHNVICAGLHLVLEVSIGLFVALRSDVTQSSQKLARILI